jgi:hypothetical protein
LVFTTRAHAFATIDVPTLHPTVRAFLQGDDVIGLVEFETGHKKLQAVFDARRVASMG